MPASAIKIDGLAQFQKTLKSCERDVRLGVKASLRAAAEPVRVEAERLAPQEIKNVGPDWSQMRVGLTTSVLYVAPKQRTSSQQGRKRRNMAGLLGRVLDDALESKSSEAEGLIEKALDDILERNW